jgi:hypothetical protein
MTACSSEVEHAPEERGAVGSKPTGRARQGIAQPAERRRAMPEAAGAEPASLTMTTADFRLGGRLCSSRRSQVAGFSISLQLVACNL